MSAAGDPPLEWITHADDPRLAGYRDLGRRPPARAFVAEGRLLVRRLLAAPRFQARSVLLTPAAVDGLTDLLRAMADPPPVYVAEPATIDRVVGFDFHRGCLALGEPPVMPSLDALLAPRDMRLLVALDDVTNPDNVGAVFRNAAAFGAAAVVLSPACGDPLYRKALRVSMGGALDVPFARVSSWPEALACLRSAGFTLVALTPDAPLDVAELTRPRRVALVVGAEGTGLGRAARQSADVAVAIPMACATGSLNVATATGIALYLLSRSPSKGAS
jgi:tRNA G18 (ribose-2'-O)-methylase SpoU